MIALILVILGAVSLTLVSAVVITFSAFLGLILVGVPTASTIAFLIFGVVATLGLSSFGGFAILAFQGLLAIGIAIGVPLLASIAFIIAALMFAIPIFFGAPIVWATTILMLLITLAGGFLFVGVPASLTIAGVASVGLTSLIMSALGGASLIGF